MSKGSRQRPVDKPTFNDNFDQIFGVKKTSPDGPVTRPHSEQQFDNEKVVVRKP